MNIKHITRGAVATVAALLLTYSAQADITYHITIDTSALTLAPYFLDFNLTDGSQSSDGNNTVTLSGFTFTGGNALGSAVTLGGAKGDFNSTISLTDSSSFSDIYQSFSTNTTSISFDLTLTGLNDAGISNDTFTVSVLDNKTNAIATTDVVNSTLLTFNLGSTPSFNQYAGTSPTVNAQVSAVPEPSTYALLGLGTLVALVIAARRRNA